MNFILVSIEQVISVGKRHDNYGKRRHYQPKKKHWYVYFLDEDATFQSKRIHWYEVLNYKRRKVKVIDK